MGKVTKVILDKYGFPLADVAMRSYLNTRLAYVQDIHVCNVLAIQVLRSILIKMPVESRPKMQWIFYDKEVTFDNDLRSFDAWTDPRTSIFEDTISELL